MLSPDQTHFWNILKFDPKTMAAELGAVMQLAKETHGADSTEFFSTVDHCMYLAMSHCHVDIDVIKMTKHWLTHLDLPFDPSKMKSFEQFHNKYFSTIQSCNLQQLDWN